MMARTVRRSLFFSQVFWGVDLAHFGDLVADSPVVRQRDDDKEEAVREQAESMLQERTIVNQLCGGHCKREKTPAI